MNRNSAVWTLSLSVPLLLVGCRNRHHHTVYVPPPIPSSGSFLEYEPNNTPPFANYVGHFDFASYWGLYGYVQPWAGSDEFDAFEFTATTDAWISFDLFVSSYSPFADLDLWVSDSFGNVWAFFETVAYGGESGGFFVYAGEVFHVVVLVYEQDSDYVLDLFGAIPSTGDSPAPGRAEAGVVGGSAITATGWSRARRDAGPELTGMSPLFGLPAPVLAPRFGRND